MDDDKQLDLDLDFSLSSDTTYTYTGGAGSTVGGITPCASDHTYSISISDTNDTGSEWTYNDPTITIGDTSSWDDSFTTSPSSIYANEVGGAMRKRLEAIENRLNILVPDPKKLEKFEALQKAYEHYKHLEKLCEIEEDQ